MHGCSMHWLKGLNGFQVRAAGGSFLVSHLDSTQESIRYQRQKACSDSDPGMRVIFLYRRPHYQPLEQLQPSQSLAVWRQKILPIQRDRAWCDGDIQGI